MQRSLKVNISANLLGRSYTAVCGIVFVPVYLHFLGVESYGLFSLLNSYMAMAFLLDVGFSGALTREIARLSELAPERTRDLVWSIGLPYCAVAVVLALAIYGAAPWIAMVIVHDARNLHQPVIIASVGFAGFALALQLPIFLFTGGLAGLQRQDLANAIVIASTTLRYGGSVFLLWSAFGSVPVLMIWQAVVAMLTAVAAFTALWRQLPSNHRWPQFRGGLLRDLWGFAVGTGSAALLGMLVMQSDKVFVGALLPLKNVGIYMVASVIATNLMLLAQPISAAAFPRLAQLYARGDVTAIRATFRKVAQLMAATVLPLGTVIAFFPEQTISIWTGDRVIAADAAPLLCLLVMGTSYNALSSVPYSMILATGRIRRLFLWTMTICAVALPLFYLLTRWRGMFGTAMGMLGYQLSLLAVSATLVLPLLGSREWWQWISVDVLLSQILILLVAMAAGMLAPASAPRDILFLILAATWLAAALTVAAALPSLRHEALSYFRKIQARLFQSAS